MEFDREELTLREGSFAYYKNKCEQQAKYIKTLESANQALLESMERMKITIPTDKTNTPPSGKTQQDARQA